MKHYDVIVAGGGITGSIAAKYCAKAGLKTLIIERKGLVGSPVRCAEGFSLGVYKKFIGEDERFIQNRVEYGKIVSPDGTSFLLKNEDTGIIVDRKAFDLFLMQDAADHGAEIMLKTNVDSLIMEDSAVKGVETSSGYKTEKLTCNLLIAADGVESRVAQMAGIDTRLSLDDIDTCYQYQMTNIDVDDNVVEFIYGKEQVPGGYIWIFPKSRSYANVGLGVLPSMAGSTRAKEYLDRFVAKRFPNGRPVCEAAGGVPVAKNLDKPYGNGILVAGDAARMTNALSGAGIGNGMISGKMAADMAAEAFEKGRFDEKFLKKYKTTWDKEVGKSLDVFYKVKTIFTKFEDEDLNKICKAAAEFKGGQIRLLDIIKLAVKDYPWLLKEVIKILF